MGFGEQVPFEQYHFPPRPAHLTPLTRPTGPYRLVLDARHPTATLSIGNYEIEGSSQMPGLLTVSVPGGSKTFKFRDYHYLLGDCLVVPYVAGRVTGVPVIVNSQYTTATGTW